MLHLIPGGRAPLLIALLALAAAPAAAQPRPGATVDSLLAYARQSNPEFAYMRLEAEAAAARVAPAGNLPDPSFAMELRDITRDGTSSATLNPSNVGSTKYTVRQMFPWPGKRDLARAAAEASAEQSSQAARAAWNELAMRIKVAHARRYELAQRREIVGEIDTLLAGLEAVTRSRYAGGLASQADAVRALSERTMLRGELISLASQARAVDAQVNALLARPPDAPLAAPSGLRLPAEEPQFPALAGRLRDRNPELAADRARLDSAERSRELAYRNRYPDFALAVSPIQRDNRLADWDVMFEVTIPLQQGTRRAQEKEAEAMVAAAGARREATMQRAMGELGTALAQLAGAREMARLTEASLLPQARLNLQAALAAYETGKVDFPALLDAERQVRQARLSLLAAEVEAQTRLAEIERLIGEDL
ncbi:MAG: TolC family protein [Burkholderiaceae bacterium]|jgi:outer membrane protein TolC|nr:TolC family protein [Burkholderiaceae bacterium]